MGRRPKAWGPALHGILVIDKPLGMSSNQVVGRVRHAARGNRTGHAGTLDPLATGVLVCCIGRATKTVESLMGQVKIYETAIDLAAFTITDDAEGAREEVVVEVPPDAGAVAICCAGLTGTIMQRPPAYSALKVGGRPAYARARAGELLDLPPRPVRIDAIEILRYAWPVLELRITCGRGTYIRALARAIGEGLGTGGHLTALRRTAVGPYRVAGARRLDELPTVLEERDLLPVPDQPPAPLSPDQSAGCSFPSPC